MSIAQLIRAMSAAGASAEAIAIAVDAIEATAQKLAEKRSTERDRKRRQRQRDRDSHGTVTGQSPDSPAPPSLEVPPQTPLPNPNLDITPYSPPSDAENDNSGELKPQHVVDEWNLVAQRHGLPLVRQLTGQRKRKLLARIRDHPLPEWMDAFNAIERNPWMHGENDRGWRADFDFLLQPDSFQKLIEGSYDRAQPIQRTQ